MKGKLKKCENKVGVFLSKTVLLIQITINEKSQPMKNLTYLDKGIALKSTLITAFVMLLSIILTIIFL